MGQPHRRGSTGKLKESSFVCIAVYSKSAREIGTIDFSDPFLNFETIGYWMKMGEERGYLNVTFSLGWESNDVTFITEK